MRPAAGFTLVETLVALVVLAMIGLMLAEGMRVAGRAWESIAGEGGEAEPAVARMVLRRVLTSALPLGEDDPGFRGGPEAVELVAPAPVRSLPAGLLRLVVSRVGDDLVLAWAPVDGGPVSQRRLVGGVMRVQFDYLGPEGWQPGWAGLGSGLPSLVRLRLWTREGAWPDLVAAPMVREPAVR